jgi:hypothetical protein
VFVTGGGLVGWAAVAEAAGGREVDVVGALAVVLAISVTAASLVMVADGSGVWLGVEVAAASMAVANVVTVADDVGGGVGVELLVAAPGRGVTVCTGVCSALESVAWRSTPGVEVWSRMTSPTRFKLMAAALVVSGSAP